MNIELTSLGVQIVAAVAVGVGVYAGIRAGLAMALDYGKRALNRIDDHIDTHHAK